MSVCRVWGAGLRQHRDTHAQPQESMDRPFPPFAVGLLPLPSRERSVDGVTLHHCSTLYTATLYHFFTICTVTAYHYSAPVPYTFALCSILTLYSLPATLYHFFIICTVTAYRYSAYCKRLLYIYTIYHDSILYTATLYGCSIIYIITASRYFALVLCTIDVAAPPPCTVGDLLVKEFVHPFIPSRTLSPLPDFR